MLLLRGMCHDYLPVYKTILQSISEECDWKTKLYLIKTSYTYKK